MAKPDKGWIAFMIIMCLLLAFSIFMFGKSIYEYNNFESRADDYCKDNGWDDKVIHLGKDVCYKGEPHPSGVGVNKVYSGEITKKLLGID